MEEFSKGRHCDALGGTICPFEALQTQFLHNTRIGSHPSFDIMCGTFVQRRTGKSGGGSWVCLRS